MTSEHIQIGDISPVIRYLGEVIPFIELLDVTRNDYV